MSHGTRGLSAARRGRKDSPKNLWRKHSPTNVLILTQSVRPVSETDFRVLASRRVRE